MQTWFDFLEKQFGLTPIISSNIITSLSILLVLWFLRRAVLRFVKKSYTDSPESVYNWLKGTQYIFYILALMLLALIWIPAVGNIGAFLGIVSAGLAIAFQDLLINFAGWLFILLRRPFGAKDRIQIGIHIGDVVDVGVFQITLLEIGNWVAADQSTGRVLHVPNGKIFTETVANYSQGLAVIWHEIPIMITFESNWEKAKRLLQEIAERHSETDVQYPQQALRDYIITYTHLSPNIYTTIADSGVILTIRFLCYPRNRRTSHSLVTEEILLAFNEAEDIDFAYETRRNITTPASH